MFFGKFAPFLFLSISIGVHSGGKKLRDNVEDQAKGSIKAYYGDVNSNFGDTRESVFGYYDPVYDTRGKGKKGESCDDDEECESTRCIRYKCASKKDIGRRCGKDSACKSGICINKKCSEALMNGKECQRDHHCLSGKCNHIEGYTYKCEAETSYGNGCNNDEQCLDGLICGLDEDYGRFCLYKEGSNKCYRDKQCASRNCDNYACKGARYCVLDEHCPSTSKCENNVCKN